MAAVCMGCAAALQLPHVHTYTAAAAATQRLASVPACSPLFDPTGSSCKPFADACNQHTDGCAGNSACLTALAVAACTMHCLHAAEAVAVDHEHLLAECSASSYCRTYQASQPAAVRRHDNLEVRFLLPLSTHCASSCCRERKRAKRWGLTPAEQLEL
jgi:hypothetical protein